MHAIAGGSGRHGSATRLVGSLIATLLLAMIVSGAVPAGVRAASRYVDPVFSSVRRDADLVYGSVTHSDGTVERLKLDLYRPAGDSAGNRPALIYVHGGNYTVRKEAERNRMAGAMFAKRGFVGAVIQYRTGVWGNTREATWDLRAAVRWFRKNASWLRISPNRIVVMGSSAGATAALNVAFDPADVGTSGNPGYSSAVAAAISMSGYTNEHDKINAGDPPIAMIVAKDDHPFWENTHVNCNETRLAGNVCDLFEYESGGHPPDFWVANAKQIVEQSSRFICRNVLMKARCN